MARVLDAGLLVCALGGVLAAAWWVLALTLGLGLVTFATGSMAPALPQGSLAVVAPVALDAVGVGDVVTVDRGAGLLPITHRVVSVERGRGVDVLHLKGDANQDPDPRAYRVHALHRVVLGLPGWLDLLRLATTPLGGLAAVLAAAVSTVWSLWPAGRAAEAAPSGVPAT